QEEDTREADGRRQQWQRRLDQRDAHEDPEPYSEREDRDRQRTEGKPEFAEELDWPVESAVEEIEDEEIEDDASNATHPVFRAPEAAWVVVHGELGDSRALTCRLARAEVVHLTL